MQKSEFMKTWQVDWVSRRSFGVVKDRSRVCVYPDPGGHENGVVIRYTNFKYYPTLQNGHYVEPSRQVVAMTSKYNRIVLRLKRDRLIAKTQNIWFLRFLAETTSPRIAKLVRPVLLFLLGRRAWSARAL